MTDREDERRLLAEEDQDAVDDLESAVSGAKRLDYGIALAFCILGAGMLWPFNAFITANEFFRSIFAEDALLLSIYAPSITSVFTATNLVATLYFTKTVGSADLDARISRSALATTLLFAVLALSTVAKLSARGYFALLMVIIAATGITTGGLQNGAFGMVGGYGAHYTQYMMIGQGIAGVTPAILSMVVALVDRHAAATASKRAFAYFLSSSIVLASATFAHLHLKGRAEAPVTTAAATEPDLSRYRAFLASPHPWTVALVFAVTLSIFPSVTATVTSVLPTEGGVPFDELPRILQPSVYIPLGFLVWNGGDLLGRIATVFLRYESPRGLFCAALLRILWIPAIYLCNVRGAGAVVKSDAFFILFMLLFGASNGILGSLTLAAAVKQAPAEQKRDIGSFMTLMLCLGLVIGSLASFLF